MKKYILITVFEREISTSKYNTFEEAQEAMKTNLFIDDGTKEAFEEGAYTYNEETKTYSGDGWELTPTSAWCNGSEGNWDALIEEINMEG